MPTISLTLPVSGTVITAGLHSTNYTTLQNAINGNLDTANWATGKIFAPSKLMQEGATAGQTLLWNAGSSTWVPNGPNPQVYARATAGTDVANTVTETSIFSQSISGGDMGTNRMLRLTLLGDFLHNNVAADAVTLRVKFGGTTFYSQASNLGNVIGAGRHPWHIYLHIANLGATNSQMILGQSSNSEAANAAAPGTGIGNWFNPVTSVGGHDFGISTLGTIDTTANQTLDVTAQWGAASANNSWRLRYGVLELI